MKFFDSYCAIGKTAVMNPLTDGSLSALEAEMKKCEVEKVLAYHRTAQDVSPRIGNQEMLTLAALNPNVIPMWVVLPHHTDEFEKPKDCIDQMKQHGVKAVRMFPHVDNHNFGFNEYSCKDWFDALEETHIPLFMDLEQAGWDRVDDILSHRKELRLVLTNIGYRCSRYLYPLIEKHPHLYADTSRFFPHQGVEDFVSHFGSQRLLFGSGLFAYEMGAGVFHIRHLMLAEEQKQEIAAGNLERLLEEVRDGSY